MPQGRFVAQVEGQVARARALREAVFKESVQRTVDLAQTPVAKGGNMPVTTGFLRASGRATADGSLPHASAAEPVEGRIYSYDAGAVSLVIANADVTDTIVFAYTARYARYQEYGAQGRDGRRFVGLAAQQWPRTVAEVTADAKARSTR